MRRLISAAVILMCTNITARGQAACDYSGSLDPLRSGEMKKALWRAKSCGAAVTQWRKCPIDDSSAMAYELTSIIIAKCERNFLDKLSTAAQNRYADEKQLCFYRYARQQGTMWGAPVAECDVDVAAQFAANPELANQPAARASFDCGKAKTTLETAICSDAGLGRADLVLSRLYTALKKTHKEERRALAQNDKKWRQSLPADCHLSVTPLQKSLNCVRTEFENRFTALEDCHRPISECLYWHEAYAAYEEEQNPKEVAETAAWWHSKHPASFSCEAPSSVLESVICEDARLGRMDIKLARAYHDAVKTMAAQQEDLAESHRGWLAQVNGTCPMGASERRWFRYRFAIPPLPTRACVRAAFERRIAQLQTCPKKEPEERIRCLNDFRTAAQ